MLDQTKGFDVIYEISTERFLRVLDRLIVDELPSLLNPLDFSTVFAALGQTGTLALPFAPRASLQYKVPADGKSFTLSVTFPNGKLSLNDVINPVTGLIVLRGLEPVPIGDLVIDLPLQISTNINAAKTQSPIQIGLQPGALIGVSKIDSSLLNGLIAIPQALNLDSWVAKISGSIETTVRNRLMALFPRIVDINLPSFDLCDLGFKDLQVKLLNGSGTLANSLAFFVTLRSDTMGRLNEFNESNLGAGMQGSMIASNKLLLKLICCTLPRSAIISGLPLDHIDDPDGRYCRWENLGNVVLEGTSYNSVKYLEIGWDQDMLYISGKLGLDVNWCVSATVEFKVKIKFSLSSLGTIISEPADYEPADVHTSIGIFCVIVIVAAVILVLTGIGGAAGALIGVAAGSVAVGAFIGVIVGGVAGILLSIMIIELLETNPIREIQEIAGALLGPLASVVQNVNILPKDLTDTFGVFDALQQLVVDDFTIAGRIGFRNIGPPVAASDDQVLHPGEMIDLDTGRVFRASAERSEGDGDLQWHSIPLSTYEAGVMYYSLPGTQQVNEVYQNLELADINAARMVALENSSFHSLTLADLEALHYPVYYHNPFPAARIPQPSPICSVISNTPVTQVSMMRNAVDDADCGCADKTNSPQTSATRQLQRFRSLGCQPFLFAVRTTEGRYARCQAWKDNVNNLHLRYTTFNSQMMIEFKKNLRRVEGTAIVKGPNGLALSRREVSWRGDVQAIISHLRTPYQFIAWKWNDIPVNGAGILPGTSTHFEIAANKITLRTAMGETLQGELFVHVRDSMGIEVSKTLLLSQPGTVPFASTLPTTSAAFPLPAATQEHDFREQVKQSLAKQLDLEVKDISFG